MFNKNLLSHKQRIENTSSRPELRKQPKSAQAKIKSKFQNKYHRWRQKDITNDNMKINKAIETINKKKSSYNSKTLQNSLFTKSSKNFMPKKIANDKKRLKENAVK